MTIEKVVGRNFFYNFCIGHFLFRVKKIESYQWKSNITGNITEFPVIFGKIHFQQLFFDLDKKWPKKKL